MDDLNRIVVLVNTIDHCLTTAAIMDALGFNPNGTLAQMSPEGYPPLAILLTERGTSANRLNALRVAISAWGKKAPVGRTFEVLGDKPVVIYHAGYKTEIEFLPLRWGAGTKQMRLASVASRMRLS